MATMTQITTTTRPRTRLDLGSPIRAAFHAVMRTADIVNGTATLDPATAQADQRRERARSDHLTAVGPAGNFVRYA